MPKIPYKEIAFSEETQKIIQIADQIVTAYQAQGFDLTLRQLYYQFVAKDLWANSEKNYNRLKTIVNDARLAGLLDWTAIVDRTRNLMSYRHFSDPAAGIEMAAAGYREDVWKTQPHRVEVWFEKDALAGVLEACCPRLAVPYFSCRGYTSQSEMWGAAQRIIKRRQVSGQRTIILHLGDHDPSGIDMTRDIKDRLAMFTHHHLGEDVVFVKRIALTMKQIERYKPPPNPAKKADGRYKAYVEKYGQFSWELDALPPNVLVALVQRQVLKYMDEAKMQAAVEKQKTNQRSLIKVAQNWTTALDACN